MDWPQLVQAVQHQEYPLLDQTANYGFVGLAGDVEVYLPTYSRRPLRAQVVDLGMLLDVLVPLVRRVPPHGPLHHSRS